MSTTKTVRPVWTVLALRVAAALFLLMTLVQGLLAGLFVTGDVGLLTVHSAVGWSVPIVALVMVVAALLARRAGRSASWRLVVLSAFALAITSVQVVLGMTRWVAAHVFLGVMTAAVGMLLLLVSITDTTAEEAA